MVGLVVHLMHVHGLLLSGTFAITNTVLYSITTPTNDKIIATKICIDIENNKCFSKKILLIILWNPQGK